MPLQGVAVRVPVQGADSDCRCRVLSEGVCDFDFLCCCALSEYGVSCETWCWCHCKTPLVCNVAAGASVRGSLRDIFDTADVEAWWIPRFKKENVWLLPKCLLLSRVYAGVIFIVVGLCFLKV